MRALNSLTSSGTASPQRIFLIAMVAMIVLSVPAITRADDSVKTQEITLFTAVVEKGDVEKIPAELKAYGKSLLRIAKAFRLAGKKKNTKLESGKEVKVSLPEKIGDAKITWNGKTATLKIEKDGKSLATFKLARFPTYLADDKLLVNGMQVVLIIDKGKK